LKWIDLPPVWLAVFLALAWIQARNLPLGPPGGAVTDLAGGLLVGAGVLAMIFAVLELRRARTTVIPHLAPDALVTTGIFARSRNPIYVGDALVLAGLCLRWEAWPSLVLVPLFLWLLTDRFVLAEEARLRAAFGSQFDAYAAQVRRWL
jgi:protein-S-isoprenylcysteine O-methyltransferase Ste14